VKRRHWPGPTDPNRDGFDLSLCGRVMPRHVPTGEVAEWWGTLLQDRVTCPRCRRLLDRFDIQQKAATP